MSSPANSSASASNAGSTSTDAFDTLGEMFVDHGPPHHIRSDSGSEFIANVMREWLERMGVKTLYIKQEAIGTTGTAKALTRSSATNSWRVKFSMTCVKPRCSSKAGGYTTTQHDRSSLRGIAHLRQRPSCSWYSYGLTN
jgi:hypothetical protein|tara:strand:+ start:11523 stop:11942 length:420 start_codon:yes stop_codon:yes gene_type:complete